MQVQGQAFFRALPAMLLLVGLAGPPARADDPFVDAIVSFVPGTEAGFGQAEMPDIVLGPPEGSGDLQGSLDVLALGNGGEIVVRFDGSVICDGDGVDFTIFENAFHAGSVTGPVFSEVGIVAVSQDGQSFFEFQYDALSLTGFAGLTPVYSNSANGIDPLDPTVSGGDAFDLAAVGLEWAAYVRITDPGVTIADPGNLVPPGNNAGFDLDAIALVHGCSPPTSTTMPSPTSTTTSTTLDGANVCGDGEVGGEEQCDDGDTAYNPGQYCRADCLLVPCGQPVSPDAGAPVASDALFVLRAAVGGVTCGPCVCDANGAGGITAADALLLLRKAVDQNVTLLCPAGNACAVSARTGARDVAGYGM